LSSRIVIVSLIAWCSIACSKNDSVEDSDQAISGQAEGSKAALPAIQKAARVWSREQPTVDVVAAELEGVVMARTTAQAIMHYPGYRIILTTPGETVTRINFQFDDAKPSIRQLTELFGEPAPHGRGMLFKHEIKSTGQRINLLAETVSSPADESTLVKGMIIEGARIR
jgi:hypothetical protein